MTATVGIPGTRLDDDGGHDGGGGGPRLTISGRRLLAAMAIMLTLIGVSSYLYLRQASRLRFAVGVRPVPDEGQRRLPVDRPFTVQIEKRSAGRSPLRALALLLDANGQRLAPPQALQVGQVDGQPTEGVTYPPMAEILRAGLPAGAPARIPPQGLVGVIVVRLPRLDPQTTQQVDQAVGRGGPLHLVYGRVQRLCRTLDGNAEMVSKELDIRKLR